MKWGEIWTRFKKFSKNVPICLGKFLKQNHRPAKLSYSFSSSGAKFGGIENFSPLKSKVSVCLWLELCTMICWGASLSAVIRGVTTGVESIWGRRKVLTMSQVLQCSTFSAERPQVRIWGRQICFLPRASSNLVTPLTIIQYSSALSMYIKWRVAQLHSYVGYNSLS